MSETPCNCQSNLVSENWHGKIRCAPLCALHGQFWDMLWVYMILSTRKLVCWCVWNITFSEQGGLNLEQFLNGCYKGFLTLPSKIYNFFFKILAMSEFFENLPPLFFYSDHFSILHYPSEMPQFRYQGGVGHVFNHPSAISTWRGWWKWLDEQRFLKPSTSLRNLAHQISHGGHILILILRSREVNRSIERRRRRMRTFEATFQQRLLPVMEKGRATTAPIWFKM